jgi:hypothetical protein
VGSCHEAEPRFGLCQYSSREIEDFAERRELGATRSRATRSRAVCVPGGDVMLRTPSFIVSLVNDCLPIIQKGPWRENQ